MGGSLPFEWIEADGGRLAIMQHPPGGPELDRYLAALRALGVDVLVSMLADEEAKWMGLGGEADSCARQGIEFLHFPIEDHRVPDSWDETSAFACRLKDRLRAGLGVVIHCYAGIGRSALMGIATLVGCGLGLEEAIDRVSSARGFEVPEPNQREWLARVVPSGTARAGAGR